MFVLLSLACKPEILVELDLEGATLDEMRGGFVARKGSESDAEFLVMLTSYEDPCSTLSRAYEEAAIAFEASSSSSTDDWTAALEDATSDLSGEPHDVVLFEFSGPGGGVAPTGELSLAWPDGPASVVVETDRVGLGRYVDLFALDGSLTVSALDPATGEGEATVSASPEPGAAQGTLVFSFEVDDCPEYAPALAAYENLMPGGCRSVSCY